MALDLLGAPPESSTLERIEREATEKAKVVSARVSPWLWVLSIGSFGMAVANRYQIGKMFGSFTKMRDTLWTK